MKKLLLLVTIALFPFKLNAADPKQVIAPNARFLIFTVQFDKKISGWPEGISQVNADGYKKINESNAVIKMDILTGESWVFQIGTEGSFLWVPIVLGTAYTK